MAPFGVPPRGMHRRSPDFGHTVAGVQTDLVLVLMVFVAAFAVVVSVLCWATLRRVGTVRQPVRQLADRMEQGHVADRERLARLRVQTAAAVEAAVALRERLDRADAAMVAMSLRLREGRGSIDEATQERLLPLARWFSRVVAIGRLWRMQREMWRG